MRATPIALGFFVLGTMAIAQRFSRVFAQPRYFDGGADVAATHEGAGDAGGNLDADTGAFDTQRSAGDTDRWEELARDDARHEGEHTDPCPPPRAVIDRAGHCCLPGQRVVDGQCAGVPTSCPPGNTHDRTGACVPRPVQADGAGVSAHLATVDGGELAPAGMVRVPGGTFRSGGQWVSVGPFFIDTMEVTADAYRRCVRAGVCAEAPDPYGQMPVGAAAPVVNVTWQMAARYCGWAGGRLPTEHEWELAARGIDGRRFPWGERLPDCSLARYAGCGDAPLRVGMTPAGRSPFGLLDTVGNVAEWTADRFGPRGSREPSGEVVRDPTGAPQGMARVVRGGSFASPITELSLDARASVDAREARADLGFRCARGL